VAVAEGGARARADGVTRAPGYGEVLNARARALREALGLPPRDVVAAPPPRTPAHESQGILQPGPVRLRSAADFRQEFGRAGATLPGMADPNETKKPDADDDRPLTESEMLGEGFAPPLSDRVSESETWPKGDDDAS
jgi:hypothetical protein